MQHEYVLWIAMFVYGFHAVEEFMFDWKDWAASVLGLPVTWPIFYIVNGVVIVLGIACSEVGWNLPVFALSLPALMLINGTFFHVLPFIVTKGRFSPGLASAVSLFYPVAGWCYYGAHRDGVLTTGNCLGSFVLGGLLMASPIAMLRLRSHAYFQQPGAEPSTN